MEIMVLAWGSTRFADLLADADWGHHMDGWGGSMALGWVFMALLVVLVAGLIWASASGHRHAGRTVRPRRDRPG